MHRDRDLTEREISLLRSGHGRFDRGYVVPVIRGGDPSADPPVADPPADHPPAADPPADRTFSQADVDRIVQERIARVKTQPPPDYETLKEKAARLAEIEEANQTELERAQARLQEIEQRERAANQRLIEAAVLAEASRQQAIKPEHMPRLIDMNEVTIGDDGQVIGVEDAIKAFLGANPEYVGTRAPGSADQGARGGNTGVKQVSETELRSMSPEQIVKARAEGRLNGLLGVR